jgi:hypothetical protein
MGRRVECPPCQAGRHYDCYHGVCDCRAWIHRDETDYEPDYDTDAELERALARYERSVYGEIGDMP